uniref:Uncharacterized protein n=1 Tax=Xiphophorus maculatus TaxID=8083 RepID=A0A3B5QFH5_XIPMA
MFIKFFSTGKQERLYFLKLSCINWKMLQKSSNFWQVRFCQAYFKNILKNEITFVSVRLLTRQRQIPRWVAFCFGQAAVLTAAVLQDVSSRRHSVLWITHNVKHATRPWLDLLGCTCTHNITS